jgi:hypothetical protein
MEQNWAWDVVEEEAERGFLIPWEQELEHTQHQLDA